MRKLSYDEELAMLREVRDNKYEMLDYGSSRIVYKAEFEGRKVVFKVAIAKAGTLQNKHEIEAYEEYGEGGLLAEIYAYGEFIVVMELLNDCDRRSDRDSDYYSSYTNSDGEHINGNYAYSDWSEYRELLYEINGCDDGVQVGENEDGEYKIYDYGFSSDGGCRTQCSNVQDYMSIDQYLDVLVMQYDEFENVGEWIDDFEDEICNFYHDNPDQDSHRRTYIPRPGGEENNELWSRCHAGIIWKCEHEIKKQPDMKQDGHEIVVESNEGVEDHYAVYTAVTPVMDSCFYSTAI